MWRTRNLVQGRSRWSRVISGSHSDVSSCQLVVTAMLAQEEAALERWGLAGGIECSFAGLHSA